MIFSAAQPSGKALHLGNYLGAIKQWVGQQDAQQCLFCIVDLHALTSGKQNNMELGTSSLGLLAAYIACGIDPSKAPIFLQSHVPEHTELCWLLGCMTPIGWLNRMTQYKDKSKGGNVGATLGLYSYPVLMAADILLYKASLVPVGNDQQQHIELAQDIAKAFNTTFSVDYFSAPRAMPYGNCARIMSLRDGTKKMSKSDASDFSRINLSDDDDTIALKVKKATTDSLTGFVYEELSQRPELCNLVNIFAALAQCESREVCTKFHGSSTKEFKDALTELLIEKIGPIRTKISELLGDVAYLQGVLREGRDYARSLAMTHLREIKTIIGLYQTL
ncbi:tryptophan--tRNA ligase [Candidatus Anaplasma sp. TIGMIC]|uniref:tryptophan--tRNA ligase n=1 Tax=Candidatus Anaplasma sp. TIGMIC TaxID=3020713 RepID=UPI00232F400C|nr:tryptophan--tRNA ligase [Candidatus Anaplasma sp. TIGMIC]MDB1135350.1 tryptophan--tRNA ligase [Candidatus Anaplasma sp. TIGMIC]